ncbi:ATP-binding cassette domain-containing protein, partial [Gluconacetobacter azotocaptans]
RLSGGERARMRLARALAVEAPYLLADEPVAALDPAHALAVMDVFRRLAAGGAGVVVVLHDLMLAARFCDRIVLMHAGQVAAQGRPADVLTDAALRAVYGVEVRRIEDAVIPWRLAGATE